MAQPSAGTSPLGIRVLFQSERASVNADLTSRLVEFISGARESLDCAIYDLRHPRVIEALRNVVRGGKRLRIAYDASKERIGGLFADPKPSGTEEALDAAGLLQFATPVHNSSHLMHNKFIVRDGSALWTGSANFTVGGLERQDNNCLLLDTPGIVAQYSATFAGLLAGVHHHPSRRPRQAAPAPTPLPARPAGSIAIAARFSPAQGEEIEMTIARALSAARRVRVLAFLLSDTDILGALARFADPAADILGVYDPNGMEDVLRYRNAGDPAYWFMRDSRFVAAPSHKFNPHTEQDFMHNKVIIIDDRLVFTGSYNFSDNAVRYFEVLYSAYGGRASLRDAQPLRA
jgi:phosphatidylserine/phosphatidylglycerophosphate/cardiolipin synthase-like enzyme